jgi:4-hydroxy-tetrahydrodipicolinate reductase
MKIGIVGYGKMGQMVEKMARQAGHQVTAILGRRSDPRTITAEMVADTDLLIEFTNPDAVIDNITQLIRLKKNLVVGTTGWQQHLPMVRQLVSDYQVGCFHAANFSLGMNLFLRVVEEAATLIGPFEQFDVAGFEAHHRHKADSPSGAAHQIACALLEKIPRKKRVVYELGNEFGNRKIGEDELHFSSLRCGQIPGTHQVLFDSPSDNITLTHTARNREGFAGGALAAAEWLQGKRGLYTMRDMLNLD